MKANCQKAEHDVISKWPMLTKFPMFSSARSNIVYAIIVAVFSHCLSKKRQNGGNSAREACIPLISMLLIIKDVIIVSC